MGRRGRKNKKNQADDEESYFKETPYVLVKSLKKAISEANDSSQLQVEAAKYLVFWVIFVLWVLLGNDIIMQRRIADTLKRKFVDQSFQFGNQGYIKFEDISSIDEMYKWTNEVFVPNFFEDVRNVSSTQSMGDNTTQTKYNDVVVLETSNRALFGIRFRQIRMEENSCKVSMLCEYYLVSPHCVVCQIRHTPCHTMVLLLI
jgi:hypothetical protein